MNERDHYEMCEDAAMAAHIAECMKGICELNGAETLAGIQRSAYKYTPAGVAVSFELDDGTRIYCGSDQARDPSLVSRVARIGCSSIIEGSSAEVPIEWIDLREMESASEARRAYDDLIDRINYTATCLWEEVHGGDDEEILT